MQAFTEVLEIVFTLWLPFESRFPQFAFLLPCFFFVFVQFSRCSLSLLATEICFNTSLKQISTAKRHSLLLTLPALPSRPSVPSKQSPAQRVCFDTRRATERNVCTPQGGRSAAQFVRSDWWAQVDSNHRPHDYQSCALTS